MDLTTTKIEDLKLLKVVDCIKALQKKVEALTSNLDSNKREILFSLCPNLDAISKELLEKVDFGYSSNEDILHIFVGRRRYKPLDFIKEFKDKGLSF